VNWFPFDIMRQEKVYCGLAVAVAGLEVGVALIRDPAALRL
jgi:hypothetical protein